MDSVISIKGLRKTYDAGTEALKGVDLDIRRGEIFGLLGENGAGKTTLIGIVCGLIRATAGTVTVDGHDNVTAYRAARARIGLVPQELAVDMFGHVRHTVEFSRGLFGKGRDPARIEEVLRSLSLWDKRDAKIGDLSGGMKRRVLIAKALAHDPDILFLDEPTAGVDVSLRRDMWALIGKLRDEGKTIILTTHYIEEAEEMADRIGVITRGELILVDEKRAMMEKLGQTRLSVGLKAPLAALPPALDGLPLTLSDDGLTIVHQAGGEGESAEVAEILKRMIAADIDIATVDSSRSSLEDIFVDLVGGKRS
ncbi:ABC-2 type transport system ATP-binding protein [Sphingomonas jejuensis]|uniref:ABC-2 type transport system ATP-binding protein n=1 Tax=Sphingomonas jejuensis TaxID=904715 RepID=A0ABX0XPS1_9SPHN|nr:ABC transporter ATP-binding protein [Sphingomonas jejuensis]NJC35235.1 ABC-2 type transport system ATP-binding protein [Sphingomonas jejuensis]